MNEPPKMTTIQLRDRRQLTLPSEITQAAGLQVNDVLTVSLVSGVIQLTPASAKANKPSSMVRFLGAAQGLYGRTAKEADSYVRQQRESW